MESSTQNPKWLKYVILVLAALTICILLPLEGFIGISADRLKTDARESQKIEDSWEVSCSVTKDMGALLFYDTEQEKHVFSIYLNRDGFSFGYFFREGGNDARIADAVSILHYEGCGTALLSMNTLHIAAIELNNGRKVTTIETNAMKPFAIALPENYGEITFYDASGTSVIINQQ